jgi:uncharacterized protein (TIGR00730 family)
LSEFDEIAQQSKTTTEARRRPQTLEELVADIKRTAEMLIEDGASRGDVKLLRTAFRELRYCFRVFAGLKHRRKITVFGSARTPPSDPSYQQAVEFGRRAAEAGFLVITGAAQGIMEAGHAGAGRENSVGINILLPFEQSANPIIAGDVKLMHLKYFFTRKLLFVKESDAVALFPGGFGTHDEAFESLTLIQTGKSHLFPMVCVDHAGDSYWRDWQNYVETHLLRRKMICPADMSLFKVTDSVEEAVKEIRDFYSVYHSMRYVKGRLVLRLMRAPSAKLLEQIRSDFRDISPDGIFELSPAFPDEANDSELQSLPRLHFHFDRKSHGRLRQMVDLINREAIS